MTNRAINADYIDKRIAEAVRQIDDDIRRTEETLIRCKKQADAGVGRYENVAYSEGLLDGLNAARLLLRGPEGDCRDIP